MLIILYLDKLIALFNSIIFCVSLTCHHWICIYIIVMISHYSTKNQFLVSKLSDHQNVYWKKWQTLRWLNIECIMRSQNRERGRVKQTAAIRDKMHQIATPICVDAIHSPNALKEYTRLYRYIELRGLFSAPIPLTVVATIAFVVVGYAPRPDNPQRFDSLQVSRLFADCEPIARLKSDSLNSIKSHLPKDYARNGKWRVTGAINNRARNFLNLRANGLLVI